jgi:membrane fusion protein, heavy metal efflux system
MISTLRIRLLGAIVAATLALTMPLAIAGGDHDHGIVKTAPAGPSSPRFVAESEAFELVGILKDGRLIVFLDRRSDTSPVVDAKIELTVDGQTGVAEPQADGTYVYSSAVLDKPGEHEVIATISAAGGNDLLVGTLKEPAGHGHDHGDRYGHDHSIHHQDDAHPGTSLPAPIAEALEHAGIPTGDIERKIGSAPVLAGLGLAVGLLIGGFARRRTGLVAGLIGLLFVVSAGAVWAGPGHDHGGGGASSASGDGPRRLPDGELFLPKPTQRLLNIRTHVLKSETAHIATKLIGRVISDPNRSGLVQSTIGGRIKAVEGGLPVLGQPVKAGEILAYVEPAFAPIDASDVLQTAGDLEQRIALLKARIARQQRLVDRQVASRANLKDLEIELEGLRVRRKQLREARNQPEPLRAPVDGVITEVRIAAGQVVSSADTLFHVIDPSSLWVEAISYDPAIRIVGASARARTVDGALFDLKFVGRSRALQQQATVLQFRLENPNESLNIGSPVRVMVDTGEPISGLIIPRNAIAQAPNGQMVAFKRLEPERYLPKAVRFEDIDGARVHVLTGLEPGDQIIVRNAPLVNQIR